MCWAELARANAAFAYEHLHKDAPYHDGSFTSWAKEQSLSHPYRYDTGVRIWVDGTDSDPGDEFMTDKSAMPTPIREWFANND